MDILIVERDKFALSSLKTTYIEGVRLVPLALITKSAVQINRNLLSQN